MSSNKRLNLYDNEKSDGYKKLNVNMIKGERIEKTLFKLGKDETLPSSSLPQNPLWTWEKLKNWSSKK